VKLNAGEDADGWAGGANSKRDDCWAERETQVPSAKHATSANLFI
jgi:hypothetical protein